MAIRGVARVSIIGVLALLIGACDYGPTHPTVPVLPSGQVGPPASLTVTAITGVGTAISLTAHVRDANGRGGADQRVDLETTSGVIDPDSCIVGFPGATGSPGRDRSPRPRDPGSLRCGSRRGGEHRAT